MAAKTALVTGCSEGGIGYALCCELQRKGVHVFAGLRTPSKAGILASLAGVDIVQLDVMSPASIAAAVESVAAKSGNKLDILINNAGEGLTLPILDTDMQAAKHLFDLNVWALVQVTQAFAPLLFQAKGTIVNISSIAGMLNTPWNGVYAASKAAVTILSETLRAEVEPFGVRVITAMTGTVETVFFENQAEVKLPASSRYKGAASQINDAAAGKGLPKKHTTDRYARELVSDILGGSSGRVWRGGAAWLVRLLGLLPQFVTDRAVQGNRPLEGLKQSA